MILHLKICRIIRTILMGKIKDLPAVPTTFSLEELWYLSDRIQKCLQDIFDRLNAYEQTGFKPDEIVSAMKQI